MNILKKKILIVDDNKFLRDALKSQIQIILTEKKLFNIFELIEGYDGVDILYQIILDRSQNNLIKCVITDENMEYFNGSEAVKLIRQLGKKK